MIMMIDCDSHYENHDNINNNDINNVLLSLIKSVNENTNAIAQLVTEIQNNVQFQRSSDTSKFEDIGNNDVNVIGFIDPDTFSGAVSNNESDIVNESQASSTAISAALTLAINNVINQLGLVNGAEQ